MADEAPPPPESPKPRKRWVRFSLRTLLVVFLIASTAPYLYKRIIVYREMDRLREVLAKDARGSFSGTTFLPRDYGYDLLIEQIEAEAQDPEIDLRVRIGLANILMDAGADENLTYPVEREGLRSGNSRAVELLGVRPYLIAALWPEVEAAFVHGAPLLRKRLVEVCLDSEETHKTKEETLRRYARFCDLYEYDADERKRLFEEMAVVIELCNAHYRKLILGPHPYETTPFTTAECLEGLKNAEDPWERTARIAAMKNFWETPLSRNKDPENSRSLAVPLLEMFALSETEDEFVRRASVDALKMCGEPGAAVVKKLAESGDAKSKDIAETGMAGAKW